MTRGLGLGLAWAVFAVAALALIAMPVSGYDWMAQMDPGIAPGSIEDADNRWPAIALIALAIALAAQVMVFRFSIGRARLLSALLMIAVVAVWLVRYIA